MNSTDESGCDGSNPYLIHGWEFFVRKNIFSQKITTVGLQSLNVQNMFPVGKSYTLLK